MPFQDEYFRKVQCLAWHGLGMWTPQNAKDKGLKLKAQDSTFFHFK